MCYLVGFERASELDCFYFLGFFYYLPAYLPDRITTLFLSCIRTPYSRSTYYFGPFLISSVYAPHTYIHTTDLTHPPRMHIYYYERPLAPCILSLCWIRRVPTHTILLMIFCRVRRRILLVCHGTYSTLGLSAEIAGWSRPSIFTWSHSEGSTIFTSRRVIQSGSELPEYVSLLVLVNLRASTI